MSVPVIFPLDPTGEMSLNRVEETYSITQTLSDQYFQFKFKNGPSFDNLKFTHVPTDRVLTPNVDYQLTYLFKIGTNRYQEESKRKKLYSACVILNKKLSGTIKAEMQYLGGDFSTLNSNWISEAVSNTPENQQAYYDDIVDLPLELPVTTHKVHTSELTTGFDDVVTALWAINESILKLSPVGKFDIEDIIGLPEELDNKVDYRGKGKVLVACKGVFEADDLEAQIQLILPKPTDSVNVVSFIAQIYTGYESYRLTVNGTVTNSGNEKDIWSNTNVTLEGTNTEYKVYCTYNQQGNPTIYISKAVIGQTIVTISDYVTSATKPEEMVDGFVISFTDDDLTGFIENTVRKDNTHLHDNILNPTPIGNTVHLDSLIDNVYKLYYPNYTNGDKLIENGFPLRESNCQVTVKYANDNSIHQKIEYSSGRIFERVITTSTTTTFEESVVDGLGRFKIQKYFELELPSIIPGGISTNYRSIIFEFNNVNEKTSNLYFSLLEMDLILTASDGSIEHVNGKLNPLIENQEIPYLNVDYLTNEVTTPLCLGIAAFNQKLKERGCILLFIREDAVIKGYSNATKVSVYDGAGYIMEDGTGQTPPLTVTEYPINENFYHKLAVFNRGQATYKSLTEEWFTNTDDGTGYIITTGKDSFILHPWYDSTPPPGYGFAEGNYFDITLNPNLASIFPSGQVVDARGQVLKGLPQAEIGNLLRFEVEKVKFHSHPHNLSTSEVNVTVNGGSGHRLNYTDDDQRASNYSSTGVIFNQYLTGGGSDGVGTQCWYQTSVFPSLSLSGKVPAVSVNGSINNNSDGNNKNLIDNLGVRWILKMG